MKGAVGWGLLALISGNLIEQFGFGISFLTSYVLMAICMVFVIFLPMTVPSEASPPIWKGLFLLATNPDISLVFFLVLVAGTVCVE